MTLLGSFWRLGRGEKRAMLEALVMVMAVRTGLRLTSFGKLLACLRRVTILRGPPGRDADTELIVWAVRAASRVAPGSDTCLVRALAMATMLTRRGEQPSVRVGVDRDDGAGLAAHAWVESGGRIIDEDRAAEAYPTPLPPIELGES